MYNQHQNPYSNVPMNQSELMQYQQQLHYQQLQQIQHMENLQQQAQMEGYEKKQGCGCGSRARRTRRK